MFKRVLLMLGTLAVVTCGYSLAGSSPQPSASQEPRRAFVLRVTVGEHLPGLLKVRAGEQAFVRLVDGTRLVLSPLQKDGALELAVRDAGSLVEGEAQAFTIRESEAVIVDAAHAVYVECGVSRYSADDVSHSFVTA